MNTMDPNISTIQKIVKVLYCSIPSRIQSMLSHLPHPKGLVEKMKDLVKKSKKNYNQGEPVLHIYKNKQTGRPKGDATISYEEAETASAAVKWFDGSTFNRSGARLSVSCGGGGACRRSGSTKPSRAGQSRQRLRSRDTR